MSDDNSNVSFNEETEEDKLNTSDNKSTTGNYGALADLLKLMQETNDQLSDKISNLQSNTSLNEELSSKLDQIDKNLDIIKAALTVMCKKSTNHKIRDLKRMNVSELYDQYVELKEAYGSEANLGDRNLTKYYMSAVGSTIVELSNSVPVYGAWLRTKNPEFIRDYKPFEPQEVQDKQKKNALVQTNTDEEMARQQRQETDRSAEIKRVGSETASTLNAMLTAAVNRPSAANAARASSVQTGYPAFDSTLSESATPVPRGDSIYANLRDPQATLVPAAQLMQAVAVADIPIKSYVNRVPGNVKNTYTSGRGQGNNSSGEYKIVYKPALTPVTVVTGGLYEIKGTLMTQGLLRPERFVPVYVPNNLVIPFEIKWYITGTFINDKFVANQVLKE